MQSVGLSARISSKCKPEPKVRELATATERNRTSGQGTGVELKLLGDLLTAKDQLDLARTRLDEYLARNWAAR
jgi:hypothetical protein